MSRPVILVFLRYYLPGYGGGGSLRSVANMVARLGGEFDFRIVTSDREFGADAPYAAARAGGWSPVGRAQVRYVNPAAMNWRRVRAFLREAPFDVLYLNSFFDYRFSILPLACAWADGTSARAVVAPRGEFSPGALELKGLRKSAYLRIARHLPIYRGAGWQASTEYEAGHIRAALGERRILIAANLTPLKAPGGESRAPRAPGPLRIAFLSRISPKKNLDFALRVLGRISQPVHFSVYGTLEDAAYLTECRALAAGLPPHVRVDFLGGVENERVPDVLRANDLFFLPTRGENYGHVIREALEAGLPVLISDRTPWRGLEAAGAGWALPLEDPAPFAAVIERQCALGPAEREAQSGRALGYCARMVDGEGASEQTRSLLLAARESGLSPA